MDIIQNYAFWAAAFGAVSIKLLELAEVHKIPKLHRPDFKDWLYWLPFLLMPLLGAGLASMYLMSNIKMTAILAFNIGASAPLILRSMAQINPLDGNPIETEEGA
ncbi:hypothetical protein CWW57_RS15465 [Vibrio parahaemolyticus]|uniref:hypothetical protein n=1 Tax=Vibrio parahaemolyticus TaxID=670 RepID=UPI000B78351F|nr:hypothetical protein [Vibrio parahaemolyticus]EGQ8137204.1 hypothetical protein [Vibrio parahaemolyticus]EGQ8150526.1 hypothetical protein [Vibrio parahaemolyticus]EGQ8251909.1 hypothetical protein [Vibrio parahaemolyticus]EGQ8266515.1 hypothetical protein [Vibrio parahaemolyticus]EGQ8271811.1 hypothetical protein [Vibrio parahaemolyticus]